MGKEGGRLVDLFDQGGGCKGVGIEMVGQDTGITFGTHTFGHFGSKSGVGSIVWLGW